MQLASRLILASTSIYRKKLLEQLSLNFETYAPLIDEEQIKKELLTGQVLKASQLAAKLAEKKALSLVSAHPDALIIGSDQVAALGEKFLGRPGTKEKAIEQLMSMQGQEHQLWTAVTICGGDRPAQTCVVLSRMKMQKMTADAIERYLERDRPFDCAGSYKFESLGISLFSRVETPDPSAIIGLPLMTVCELLRERGFLVP